MLGIFLLLLFPESQATNQLISYLIFSLPDSIITSHELFVKDLRSWSEATTHCLPNAEDNLFIRMSDSSWDKVFAINVDASMIICRKFIRGMIKNKWGTF